MYRAFCGTNISKHVARSLNNAVFFLLRSSFLSSVCGTPFGVGSALYVVDLDKFRQMAAGDSFRVVYESLSRDPNSLANLDQVGMLHEVSCLMVMSMTVKHTNCL